MSEGSAEKGNQTYQHKGCKSSSPLYAAETSVQQASKQVQVDLQDLGYETCGRSENEAEREDASSPGNTRSADYAAPSLFAVTLHQFVSSLSVFCRL